MNWKRILGVAVGCTVLTVGTLLPSAAVGIDSPVAQESSLNAGKTMSEALIAHWDFEGETTEEQLSDKSYTPENGTSKEQLKASASGVMIENGVATVDATNKNNRLSVSFSGENDFSRLETEMTVCLRFAISAEKPVTNTGFANFLVVEGNIFRGFLYQFDGANQTAKMQVRVNPNNGSSYIDTPAGNPAIALDGKTWVDVAYTIRVDGSKVLAEAYFSTDGGVTYAKGTRTITGVSPKALSSATGITLAGITHDVRFLYDDIKIFNRALTEEQIRLQAPGAILHGVQNTDAANGVFSARFVGSVNSLNYQEVGLHISANNGAKKWNYNAKTVYRSLTGSQNEGNSPVLNTYSAGNLRGSGAYLFAVSITDIPASGEIVFEVTPYWIAQGETNETLGVSYRIVFADGTFQSAAVLDQA